MCISLSLFLLDHIIYACSFRIHRYTQLYFMCIQYKSIRGSDITLFNKNVYEKRRVLMFSIDMIIIIITVTFVTKS